MEIYSEGQDYMELLRHQRTYLFNARHDEYMDLKKKKKNLSHLMNFKEYEVHICIFKQKQVNRDSI